MRKTSPFLRLTSALTVALAASAGASFIGCGGGGSTGGGGGGGSGSGACFDYTSFDGTTPVVSFKTDVLPIFRNSCGFSTCHGSQNGPGGQHFYGPNKSDPDPTASDIEVIFNQSVNQPAVADAAMKIITPGDPANSFLMYKLDGDPEAKLGEQVTCDKLSCASGKTCGDAMPQGGPALEAASRDIIRRWIAQGAKND